MVNPGQKTPLISTEIDQIIVYNRSKSLNRYTKKLDHQGMAEKRFAKRTSLWFRWFLFEE